MTVCRLPTIIHNQIKPHKTQIPERALGVLSKYLYKTRSLSPPNEEPGV